MSTLFYLSRDQLDRIKSYFPLSHGAPRVDDQRVVSGIIYVIKHGLQWKDAPREYGHIKHCITGLYAGAVLAFSIRYLWLWLKNMDLQSD